MTDVHSSPIPAGLAAGHPAGQEDPSCDVAHGAAPAPVVTRTLVAVFDSPVASFLLKYGRDAGYRPVLVEPDPVRFKAALESGVDVADTVRSQPDAPADVTARLRAAAPTFLGGQPVTSVSDLTGGKGGLPSADVLIYRLPGARVTIRPSGTEPKIKAYLEVVEPVTGRRLDQARRAAADRLDPLRDAVVRLLAG